MCHRIIRLSACLAVVAFLGMTALPAAAQPHPLAGPWYTPRELKALRTYAAASLAGKRRLLAGQGPTTTWHSLTAQEREALEAYANASFAEKQRILSGEPAVASSGSFQWRAATGGAVSVIAVALLGAALLLRRRESGHP